MKKKKKKVKYDSRRKSSPTSNLPMIISSSFKLLTIILLSLSQDKTCLGYFAEDIFCRKKVNARWIRPQFGRKQIYLIQPYQNEKVSHS